MSKRNAPTVEGRGQTQDKYTKFYLEQLQWRERNAHLWSWIESEALNLAAQGQKFSADYLVNRLRWFRPVDIDGQDARVSNTAAAVWSRWLISDHPELRENLTLRASVFDEVMNFEQ